MFKKDSKIVSNIQELSNYISEFDIYNSSILIYLNDPKIEREDYEITNYEYRPDLIAKDYYGSSNYMGLLILMSSRDLSTFKRGSVLKLIPKNILDEILKMM